MLNSRIPTIESSLPYPDPLIPPKTTSGEEWMNLLTNTILDCKFLAIFSPRAAFFVKTLAISSKVFDSEGFTRYSSKENGVTAKGGLNVSFSKVLWRGLSQTLLISTVYCCTWLTYVFLGKGSCFYKETKKGRILFQLVSRFLENIMDHLRNCYLPIFY